MAGPWTLRRWFVRVWLHGGVLHSSRFCHREDGPQGSVAQFPILRFYENLPYAPLTIRKSAKGRRYPLALCKAGLLRVTMASGRARMARVPLGVGDANDHGPLPH